MCLRRRFEHWIHEVAPAPGLDAALPVFLSVVTVLGLLVFWSLLTTPIFVQDARSPRRRATQMHSRSPRNS